jgi:2-oxoglutarate ferredoxin oxidoreductase subunit alpha
MTVTRETKGQRVLIDGSRLIIEALAQAGADTFVGYPITPANLLYAYGMRRFPLGLAAPDEITALQWMSGFASAGRVPVTATSFPGFSLMLESVNMAYMMELPMVIVQAQRLGPSTGTATCGAMGDVLLLRGAISGGYPLVTLCPSSLQDCWELSELAVRVAVSLRTPVVLLTSKEMVMTHQDFDWSSFAAIEPLRRRLYDSEAPFESYRPGADLVPEFLPVGNARHQVRLTASTHDSRGIIQGVSKDGLENTVRLAEKLLGQLTCFTRYELDEDEGTNRLVVAYDVAAVAAREAVMALRRLDRRVSLLVIKTLFPTPQPYYDIMARYHHVFIVEENHQGQLAQILFGTAEKPGYHRINSVGRMIPPERIVEIVSRPDE